MLWRDEIVFMEKDNNMKFSDFEDIQQDEFSLGRPTFPTPKGGTLAVVGWSGRKGTRKLYLVQCSECMKDEELHGDGVYGITKGKLNNDRVPCGCSKIPKWKEWQHKIRVGRVAKEKGYDFLGWDEEFKDTLKTKAVLTCHKHGEFKSAIDNVLQGSGCHNCGFEKRVNARTSPQSEVVERFRSVHGDKYDYALVKYKVARVKVKIICPNHGIFEQEPWLHASGSGCPKCAGRGLSDEEWISRFKEVHGDKYDYSKFTYNGDKGKSTFICPEHGKFQQSSGNHLWGRGCPLCAGQSQQQAYINIVNDENLHVAIKLGISVNSIRRLKEQNYNNLFQMESIGIWSFEKVEDCKRAEAECKRKLECGILSPRELKDGWSETTHLQNLEKVIEIYEKWGGIREESEE